MALKNDRVGELLEGVKHRRKILVSPEGVPLDIRIATRGERASAFILDMLIMAVAIIGLYAALILLLFARTNLPVAMTLILFLAFIVRNLYFIHFELAWQGRTPGKKICRLRVINREGGELTPAAVIARNLTREVEIFLPVSLFFSLNLSAGAWQQLALLGWVLAISLLPLFNREHLRAGDLIGGTIVVAMPKRVLLGDLSLSRTPSQAVPADWTREAGEGQLPPPVAINASVKCSGPESVPLPEAAAPARPGKSAGDGGGPKSASGYTFSHTQLSIYGAFELQVLEEFLRRPPSDVTQRLLTEVCGKIRRKIGWTEPIPPHEARRFLTDFYTAERAELERAQLFGKTKADKNDVDGKRSQSGLR